jgi:hypothetical protein
MFSGIPNETWLVIANTARNGATILAAFAACVTMLAALWQFEVQKRVNIAKDERAVELRRVSDERIAEANAAAEGARAEAAQAKLETVEVNERLLLTQERLDEANRVTPLTDGQIDVIVKGLVDIRLTDTQPVWAAANDVQAEHRLLQVTTAALAVDRHLYPVQTTGSLVAPEGEVGDVLIHYWHDKQQGPAASFAAIFKAAGLAVNVYKLGPETVPEPRNLADNFVLIGFAARRPPKFKASH